MGLIAKACAAGVISAVDFASYGTPTGACGSYAVNASCNSANSTAVVTAACVGRASCSVVAGPPNFDDPCFGTVKHLVVQARCSAGGGGQVAPSPVYAQAFVEAGGARKVLVVNKSPAPQAVAIAGARTFEFVDESTAYGPAQTVSVTGGTIALAPYSLGVARF